MARPRVVSEVRREVRELPPPTGIYLHPWLPEESTAAFDRLLVSGGVFGMYLSSQAEERIRVQASRAAERRLEVMGLMLGEVRSWDGMPYVLARDVGTTDLKNTSAKVRFDPRSLPKLFRELDGAGFDYVVVGWYHSHPGHTCFLSRTDLRTQQSLFDQSYHCALVIDPLNCEVKAFKLSGDSYAEMPFAVVR